MTFCVHACTLRAAIFLLMSSASSVALAQTAKQTPAPPPSEATPPEAEESGLDDIIVTATRRASNVQDVPIAISAVDGRDLSARNIVDPRQLSSLAPNLTVDQGAANGATHVSIRGLASTDFSLGASSPVATYIDDIYQPFQFGIGTQIFDLDRIEVLRGPQGTLFGKNTTGGALNYFSKAPTRRDEGYMSLDGGSGDFAHFAVEGAYNRVLGPSLAARLSFRVSRRESYVENLFDGAKRGQFSNYNVRLQFAWQPAAGTDINLKIFGQKNEGDGPIFITLGDPAQLFAPNSRSSFSENREFENYDSYGAVLGVRQALGDWTLDSVSGLQEGHFSFGTNDDGVGFDIFHSLQKSHTWQASQEFRLASPAASPVRAVLGLFGQYDEFSAQQGSLANHDSPALSFVLAGPADQHTTTLAAFGSLTVDATSQLSFTGGLRYSFERKDIVAPFASYTGRAFVDEDAYYDVLRRKYAFDPATDYLEINSDRHSWRKLTFDATANFKPSEQSLLYAKVSTGFRSGGYPVGTTSPGVFVRLNPETVTSYEAGFKSEWFGRHLRVNGSAFWMDYKDLQVQTPRSDGGPGLIFSNAATARIRGAELEVEAAPARGLTLSGSIGYNDATYRQFGPQTGNVLPYAPRWTGNAAMTYEARLGDAYSLIASADAGIRSRIHFDPYQLNLTSDAPRALLNTRLSYGTADDGWRITAYILNLTNQDVRAFSYALDASTNFAPTVFAPRRTWGVQARFEF